MSFRTKRHCYSVASLIYLFMLNFIFFQQLAYALPSGQQINIKSAHNLKTSYIICQSDEESMDRSGQETANDQTSSSERKMSPNEKKGEAAVMAFALLFYPTIIFLYIFAAPVLCACVYITTKILRGGRRPVIG